MSCPIRSDTDFGAYLADSTAPEWARFREHYPTCPECSRELAQWSDLEDLLRLASAPAEPAHPSEEALLAFQRQPRELAPEERRSISEHLSACALCRDALAAVASLEPGMLAPGQPLEEEAPGLLSRMAEALRSVIQRPPVPAPALATISLAVLIAAGLFFWSTWGGPGKAPSPMPDAPVAVVEPAPEPAAQGPAEAPEPPPEPEAAAVAVEAPEEPAAPTEVAAEEPPRPIEEEPAPAPTVPIPEARSAEPVQVAESQPEPKPEPVEEPAEPIPTAAAKPVEKQASRAEEVILLAALAEASPPLYVPPSLGMPSLRVGGGTRGAVGELPKPFAAAPIHVGLTAEESPTLYWFLSEKSDVPAQFALSDPDVIDPILELDIPPPIEAGLHAVRLSERGVVLQPGVEYRWFVALVPDAFRRSRDVVAGGAIGRIRPGEKLRTELEAADPSQLGHVYARNGLWYDALGFLSGWIERYPEEPRLRAQRAALLEQVGLEEAAAWERRAAKTSR